MAFLVEEQGRRQDLLLPASLGECMTQDIPVMVIGQLFYGSVSAYGWVQRVVATHHSRGEKGVSDEAASAYLLLGSAAG